MSTVTEQMSFVFKVVSEILKVLLGVISSQKYFITLNNLKMNFDNL